MSADELLGVLIAVVAVSWTVAVLCAVIGLLFYQGPRR
jgi:hypothetical protein